MKQNKFSPLEPQIKRAEQRLKKLKKEFNKVFERGMKTKNVNVTGRAYRKLKVLIDEMEAVRCEIEYFEFFIREWFLWVWL